ncbi:MAG: DUF4114 domain-containing protein [Fibrobacteria bacterium]
MAALIALCCMRAIGAGLAGQGPGGFGSGPGGFGGAGPGGLNGPGMPPAPKDYYKPYRYVQDWTADTLYVGPAFQYLGGPIRVTLKFTETSVPGKLYLINPATGQTYFLMSNTSPLGTMVDLTGTTSLKIGTEVVFMYVSNFDGVSRYTGASLPGSKYYNVLNSDLNNNPALRFGHRWSVAGYGTNRKIIEFGFEDGPETYSDMDFNDIVFQVEGLGLMIFQNSARKRDYVWSTPQ